MTANGNTAVITPANPEHCFPLTVNERTDNSQDSRNLIFKVRVTEGAMSTPPVEQIVFPESNKTIIIEPGKGSCECHVSMCHMVYILLR